MNGTEPAFTSADLAEVVDLLHRVLAKLDEYALSLPASYVQLALDHVQRAAGG